MMNAATRQIPNDSVHHVEDLGNVLLQAQRDLDRVRQKLESLPLEQQLSSGNDQEDEGAVISLKDILNRTQTNLRSKAEQVLRSIEQTKLESLPTINSQEAQDHQLMVSSLAIAAARPHVLVGDNDVERKRHNLKTKTLPYHHRTIKDKIADSRALQALAQPSKPNNRDFLIEKYALPSSSPSANHQIRTPTHLKTLKKQKVYFPTFPFPHKYQTFITQIIQTTQRYPR